jgi:hypothetical protein
MVLDLIEEKMDHIKYVLVENKADFWKSITDYKWSGKLEETDDKLRKEYLDCKAMRDHVIDAYNAEHDLENVRAAFEVIKAVMV